MVVKKTKKVASKVAVKPIVKTAAKNEGSCCSCMHCKCGKKAIVFVIMLIAVIAVAKVVFYKDCSMRRHFGKRPCAEKCVKGEKCRPCMDNGMRMSAPSAVSGGSVQPAK